MRWLVLVLGFVVGGVVGWGAFGSRAEPVVATRPAPVPLSPVAMATNAAPSGTAEPAPAPIGHPEPVAQAIVVWVRTGRAPLAAAALRKAGAAELAGELEAIDALRRAGHGALLAGDVENAAARFGQALDREQKLVPPGAISLASMEMRSSLAEALHERALLRERRNQPAEARADWERAAAFDPTHVESLAGLQRLARQKQY